MEDHRLKAFCLIIETGSFSKAAEAKFMTQSAMSHLIRNLENELGVKLFNRQGKAVTPTPAGRLFYDHARKILDEYRNMEHAVYSFMQTVKGPLSLGASHTAATYLLPQALYVFSKKYPDVRIDLSVSVTERVINDIIRGKTELGIVEGQVKNAPVVLEEIAEDEIVIIASDDNPLAKNKVISRRDIEGQTFIMPETGSGIREFIEAFLHSMGIDPGSLKVSMTLGSPELVVQMVQSGLGISFVSKWSVFGSLKDGSLALLNMPGKRMKRKFFFTCPGGEPQTHVAKTFREFIMAYRFFIPF
jgi:DNA-binding transcriptional LysR family regulator